MAASGAAVTQAGTALPSGNSARTVEFWLRGGRQNPVAFYYGGGGVGGVNDQFRVEVFANQLWLSTDSKESFSSTQYAVSLPENWWDGHWHLFDVTYDGTTALGYMDGQLLGSFGVRSPLATVLGGALTIGGYPADIGYGNNGYDVDEFAVYPSALSSTQIDAHWSLGGSLTSPCASAPAGAYAQSVVADTPSRYFRLGDLVGDSTHFVALDSSGHCTAAAPTNGAIVSSNAVGVPRGALPAGDDGALTGAANVAAASATGLPAGNAPRTVEFWLAGGRQNPVAFYYGSGGGTADQFRVEVFANQLWLTVDSSHTYGSPEYELVLPENWWDGRWHLFDVTYDGTNALGYMDGQLIGNFGVLAPLSTAAAGSLTIGGYPADIGYGNNGYDVDEFAVYPSALSSTQIDAHWSLGGSAAGPCASAPAGAYAQSVVADAPTRYFRLGDLVSDSTHFVAFDSSGRCTAAAPTNGAIVSSNAAGVPHGALPAGDDGALTGAANVVEASATGLPVGNAARTVEFWLAGGRQNPVAFYYGSGAGTGDQFRLEVFANQLWLTLDSSHGYGSTQYELVLPENWWDGRWHLFDVTYDGTNALGYMDGQLIGNFGVLTPLSTAPGGSLTIGGYPADIGYGNNGYDVDEFAVYPSALSSTQVDAHWSLGGSPAGPCAAAPTGAYAQSVLAASPVRYFRLGDLVSDSTHFVAFDSSGHCSAAAPTNGAIVSSNALGVPHGALAVGDDSALTGAANVVQGSATGLPAGNAARTVEFWLAGGRQNPVAFYYGSGSGTDDQFRVEVFANQLWLTLDSGHGYGSPQYELVLPQNWWDGRWHLFDVTYDGTNALGYMDGQLIGSFGVLAPLATATGNGPLTIGGYPADIGYGNNGFDVDEFAVYPSALSAAQIAAHMAAGEPAPAVSSVSPGTGPVGGGNWVDIRGSNFIGGASVMFGSTAAQQTEYVSASDIRAVPPSGTGTVNVTVTTAAGTSPVAAGDAYAYVLTPSAIALFAQAGGAVAAQSAPLTAVVGPSDGGGTVAFYDAGSPVAIPGCAAEPLTAGRGVYQATCSTPALAAGDHLFTARYSGDAGYMASTASETVAVTTVPTTVSLSASAAQMLAGAPVSLAADVSPGDGDGSVAFYAGGSGTPIAGCEAVPLSSAAAGGGSGRDARATCVTSDLAAGQHAISARYSGDATYASSTGTLEGGETILAPAGADPADRPGRHVRRRLGTGFRRRRRRRSRHCAGNDGSRRGRARPAASPPAPASPSRAPSRPSP